MKNLRSTAFPNHRILIGWVIGIFFLLIFLPRTVSAQEPFPKGAGGVVVAPPLSADGVVLHPFVEPLVLGLQETTPVIQLDNALTDRASVEQIARDYNAAVVVWGEVDDEVMRWRFYTPLVSSDDIILLWYRSSFIYPQHIELELSFDIDGLGLVSFVRGLNFYREQLYLRGIVQFNDAIRRLDVEGNQGNLGGLYFYSAVTHLQRSIDQNIPDLLQTAVEHSRLALDYYSSDTFPYERAATQNNLALIHSMTAWFFEDVVEVERAFPLHSDALAYWTPETFPLEHATAANNLGVAHMIYGDFGVTPYENYVTAADLFKQALVYRLPDKSPYDHALTQTNLGFAYYQNAGYDQFAAEALLQQAVAAYRTALSYWTVEDYPEQFASINRSLGRVYGFLSEFNDRQANLLRSISAHDAALTYYSLSNDPYEYAAIQMTRGLAYHSLAYAGSNRQQNLTESINAYREALRYFRPLDFPYQYAIIQGSMGDVYYALGESGVETVLNLRVAISAYEAALRYLAEADDPGRYASILAYLGFSHVLLGIEGESPDSNFQEALVMFNRALAVEGETGLLFSSVYYSRGLANFYLIDLAETPEDARTYSENFLRDMAEAEGRGEFIPPQTRRDIAAVEAELSNNP